MASNMKIKALKAFSASLHILRQPGFSSFRYFQNSINSVILPKATYSAEVWALRYTEVLDQIFSQASRRFLIIDYRSSNSFLRWITGRTHVKVKVLEKVCKYISRVFAMKPNRLPHIVLSTLISHQSAAQHYPWYQQLAKISEEGGFTVNVLLSSINGQHHVK